VKVFINGDTSIVEGVSLKYAPIEFEDSSVMEQLATEAYAEYYDRNISNVKFLGTRDGDLSPYFSFILHDYAWEFNDTPKDWLMVATFNARFEALARGTEDVAYLDYLDFDDEVIVAEFY
jgi:hypothetical protein